MKKILPFLFLLPFFGSVSAYAACYSKGAEPLFSCTVRSNGKHLEICAVPDEGIEYSFGHSITKPEMNFRLSRQDSYYEFIRGPYWVSTNLYLPLGNVTYELEHFWSAKAPETGKLMVYINHKLKATLKCQTKSINSNIDEDVLFSVSREITEHDNP